MSPKQAQLFSPEPLSDKDLGAITQTVRDWRELGLCLQISEDQLNEIDRTHRSNSERCSSMLSLWHRDMEARPSPSSQSPRDILARNLEVLGYNRLSELLMTEVDPDVFYFKWQHHYWTLCCDSMIWVEFSTTYSHDMNPGQCISSSWFVPSHIHDQTLIFNCHGSHQHQVWIWILASVCHHCYLSPSI